METKIMDRIIMHYDMDAFFASVEIRDNPNLRGKPVIVGTRVVTTCNYEARKYGLHSAMSVKVARKLCPKGIYLEVDKDKYTNEAKKIQELIYTLSDKVEFLSLDEGYIDISKLYEKYKDLDFIANKFRERIFAKTGLTCSVGIAYNKLAAKISSEINKPNGYYIMENVEKFIDYVRTKDIRIIPGIGGKTETSLNKYGIYKVGDFYNHSLLVLQGILGHGRGLQLYEFSKGIDDRPIENERKHKSIGNETTLITPINNEDLIKINLRNIFEGVFRRFKETSFFARTVTIKIRYGNRQILQKSKSYKEYSDDYKEFLRIFNELVEELSLAEPILLYGVTFSNIIKTKNEQLSFSDLKSFKKMNKIMELKDKIKKMETKGEK